jgi:hypothetical protein
LFSLGILVTVLRQMSRTINTASLNKWSFHRRIFCKKFFGHNLAASNGTYFVAYKQNKFRRKLCLQLGERNRMKAVSTVVMLLNREFTGNNNTFTCYHHVTFCHVIKSCSCKQNEMSVALQNNFTAAAVPLDNCLFTPFIRQICLLRVLHFYFVHVRELRDGTQRFCH